jgi:hypothetical protein
MLDVFFSGGVYCFHNSAGLIFGPKNGQLRHLG